MKKIILLLTMVLTIQFANATTYYVATNGNDNNNGTSSGTALATFSNAVSKMVPGDVCNVADGTYNQTFDLNINTSGSSTAWTVFKSANKGGAKILIPSTAAEYSYGFKINKSRYIQIDGFDISIQTTHGNGIQAQGIGNHHIRIYNCHIHDCGQCGIGLCDGDYYDIQWNISHHNAFKSSWQGSGISIYECVKSDSNTGFHNIIANNTCYANENKVNHPTNGITDGNGIIVDDLYRSQNAPNTVYDQSTLVENNLCYDNGGRGVYVMSSQYVTLRNNTSYMNSRVVGGGDLVCHDSKNLTWVNNIGWARSGKNAIVDEGAWGNNSSITWKNNLTFNGTAGQNSVSLSKTTTTVLDGSNKLGVNPLFVNPSTDPANCNFRLQASSPAINAGTSSYGVASNDLDFAARVQGGTVDMGAYESGASGGVSNSISIASAPSSVNQTGTYTVSVNYGAAQAGSVWVGLFNSAWSYVGGSTNYNVSANTSGVANVNVSLSNIATGTGYKWLVQLRDASNNPISGIQASQDNVTVTANTIAVTGVTMSPTSATINVNTTSQLTATVAPSNATNKTVSWSSSNTSVATVSSTGLVTAVAAGSATITVTTQDGNKTATCAVTVNAPATNTISIVSSPATIPSTGTYTVRINYTAAQAGMVKVMLLAVGSDTYYGEGNFSVTSGQTGTNVDVNITISTALAAGTYRFYASVRGANDVNMASAEANTTVGATWSNIIVNPGFESGTTSWTAGSCVLTSITTPIHGGSKALKIGSRTSNWQNASQDITSALNSNGQGTYTLSTWARMASGSYNTSFVVRIVANGTTTYFSASGTVGTSWVNLTNSVIITWTGTLTSAIVYAETSSGTVDMYVDDCNLIKTQNKSAFIATDVSATGVEPMFDIFPNPVSNGVLNLKLSAEGKSTFAVFDIQGKQVLNTTFNNAGKYSVSTFNVLKSGMYIVKLHNGNKVEMKKLLVR